MKNSLKSNLSNLVNTSRRDTSIYTSQNNDHISIINLVEKKQLKTFFDGKVSQIELNINNDFEKMKHFLTRSKSFDDLVEIINQLQIYVPRSKLDSLMNDFSTNKNKIISYILNYLENIKNKLLQIQKKAIDIQKDKGTWNLYLTRYFLKGPTPHKKQIVNAPLIMYSVGIAVEKNKLFIYKKNEINELNEKIIVFLQRDIGKQKKSIGDFEISQNISKIKSSLEDIIEKEIYISSKGDMDFIGETTNDIQNEYKKLYIEDRVCLGIYEPSGGKLKEDLEIILKSESHKEIFDRDPIININDIKEKELDAEPILQIDKLDIYQRFAVRAALTDNTIIHGPPGTGKSEVITNIISNLLFFDKDVVVVSEKVAALDVLKKRLKNLNLFSLLIYENDKEVFYKSITNLSNLLGNSWMDNKKSNPVSVNLLDKISKNLVVVKAFKNNIKRYDKFVNFQCNDSTFLDFLAELANIGGNDFLNLVIHNKVIDKYQKKATELKMDINSLFEFTDAYCDFLERYEINDEIKFDTFSRITTNLKKYFDDYSIDCNKEGFENDVLENASELSEYLIDKPHYQKTLRKDPNKFYSDVEAFKKIKSNCVGLIKDDFFNNFNKYSKTVRAFLNVFNLAKDAHKKYIFDCYINELNITNKKPHNKMFYKQKFSKNDEIVLNDLRKIVDLKLDEYNDFDYIVQNIEIFNPLSILYFFNENIFEEKYIEFISSKYYTLGLEFYFFKKEFNLNETKFNKLIRLEKTKNEFTNLFPEFLDKNLFQFLINNYKNVEWKNYDNHIKDIVKANLLKKLSNLNSHDKQHVQKCISVANLKRKQPMLKFIKEYDLALKQLFPIWIARPEQISLFIPLKRAYFKYGIYDEASQMFLERAYPLLFRSGINIVAGDDKQLKPTSFFTTRYEDDENEFEIDDLDVQESLLDRAIVTSWNQVTLKNHYRSQFKELIEFSSKYIYDNELNYASKNVTIVEKPLEVVNAFGIFDEGKNKEEAVEIIKILDKNINKFKSILVITFNSAQATYLTSLLMNGKVNNSKIVDKFLNGYLDVINIENVQGNEADLVILSISYGKKKDGGKIRSNFGPIIQDGGKNRLNVAITRAKLKMIVVKSLFAGDISDTNNTNLIVFKQFIAFLDNYEKNDNSLNNLNLNFNSAFKINVYETIKKYIEEHGLKLIPNFDIGNKKIDLVIMDKNLNKVLLGIELNNWHEEDDALSLLEEIEDQIFLEARGYKLFRIFEHEWLQNKKHCLERMFYELKESL